MVVFASSIGAQLSVFPEALIMLAQWPVLSRYALNWLMV